MRLQRSLKLLQLSAVELNLALNEISERNPFLDIKQNSESLSSFEDANEAYDLYDNDISARPMEVVPEETLLQKEDFIQQVEFLLQSLLFRRFQISEQRSQ